MKRGFRAAARHEAADAFDYYEAQQPGLGDRFFAALDEALAEICRSPQTFRKFRGSIRKFTMRAFPFSVYYVIEDDIVVVVSVFQGQRAPRKLRERLARESRPTE